MTAPPLDDNLIPSHFALAVACRMLHCTRDLLGDAIASGVIILEPCGRRPQVARAEIEKLLGRKLTAEDVLRALRDPRRRTNAKYYANRKLRVQLRPAMLELMPVKGTA